MASWLTGELPPEVLQRIKQAQPASTTPTPTTTTSAAPGTSVAPPNPDDATAQYWKNLSAGKSYADTTFAPGVMGRLTDSYQGQTDTNLGRLQGRLGGLTAQENQAAMDQGTAAVNRQSAQGAEQAASAAGAHGVSGGAAAALQNQAYQQANQNMADYQRQLILSNIQQKNIASDAYGSALNTAENRALGVGQFNIGQSEKELYGRTATPFQIASGISAQQAGAQSNWLGQQGIDVSKQALSTLQSQNTPQSNASTTNNDFNKLDPTTQHQVAGLDSTMNDLLTQAQSLPKAGVANPFSALSSGISLKNLNDKAMAAIQEKVNLAYPDESDTSKQQIVQQQYGDWQKKLTQAANNPQGGVDNGPTPGKVICTESYRQKLIPNDIFIRAGYDGAKYLTQAQLFAYWRWGKPVVRGMRKSSIFAKIVARLVPSAIMEIGRRTGKPNKWTLQGWLIVEIFDGLNYVFGLRLAQKVMKAYA